MILVESYIFQFLNRLRLGLGGESYALDISSLKVTQTDMETGNFAALVKFVFIVIRVSSQLQCSPKQENFP